MAEVSYDKATCVYDGALTPAVDALDLDIADGEFMVLVGPSGSGKSTALRMLAGLEPVADGRILIDNADVTDRPPADRDIAMVFQNYALYPHMSVADNMGFALKLSGVGKEERARRVREAARLLDLEDLLDRKPRALSGGQRQRVAMGRAIVREPQVFLMDEPLSNLDAKLRVQTRTEISSLQARLGVTTVYVTHDQVEAMTMGDRVAVLRDGVLQQCATTRELYERPVNVFVAGFIGSPAMNLHQLPVADGGVRFGDTVVPLPRDTMTAVQRAGVAEVFLGVRPESFAVVGDGRSADDGSAGDGSAAGGRGASDDGIPLKVDVVEELGSDAYVYGEAQAAGAPVRLTVRVDGRKAPRRGETLRLSVRQGEEHVFHPSTEERIA